MEATFLELLIAEAPAETFEAPVREARAGGAGEAEIERLQQMTVQALQVRAVLDERRRREVELAALNETASDLTGLRDVDLVLRAIVRRVRQLLGTDTAYLMLIDEERGEAYMRVTEGTVTPEYGNVRLELGAGLGGLVAKTASPYYTSDYHADPRFDHVRDVDEAVSKEGINAILGVPLLLRERVIGVLFAANRRVRPFAPHEVALLTSLAAHAAVAIENARLFEDSQQALADLNEANEKVRAHSAAVEQAAAAHERFTAVVLSGGGISGVAEALVATLGGALLVVDDDGRVLAAAGDGGDDLHGLAAGQGSLPRAGVDHGKLRRELAGIDPAGRVTRLDLGGGLAPRWLAPIYAGPDRLGALVLTHTEPLDDANLRTLERAALVTALVLLNQRSIAEAEQRVRGELLGDLLSASGHDPDGLRARAELLSVDLSADHAVVVAEVPERLARRGVSAAAALAAGHRGLGGEHQGRIVLVLPDLDPAKAAELVSQRLTSALDVPVTSGAQGPLPLAALPQGREDAERCVRLLLALGREGDAAAVDDLGLYALLFSQSARDDLERFVQRTIGPVVDYDRKRGSRLVETLDAYFRASGGVTQAAGMLHVHVNTLYQRLDRITRLLGHDWQSGDAALQVQLAVRLQQLGVLA